MAIRYRKFEPAEYVMVVRGGRVVREGPGLAVLYSTKRTSLLAVPATVLDGDFVFDDILTADFQSCCVQGTVAYRFREFRQAADLLDFGFAERAAVQAQKRTEVLRAAGTRLQNLTKTALARHLGEMDIRTALRSGDSLGECIRQTLAEHPMVRELGVENKKPYAEALINCSAPRKLISACPLAFGESGIKGRIQSVLHYKKPALWILIAALILSVATAVCFMLNPPEERLIRQQQTMYLTVTTSLPDFSAIEEDHFYAYDTAGILYKVGKTAPKDREYYDYSEKLTEGDRIVVFAEKPIRIRDHSGYPESRTPSYAVQATCIQLHQSLRVDDDPTDGRWFRATVVSQTEDYLLVKPHPRTKEAAQAELINISLSNVAYPTNWKIGDPVSIYYSGPIDRGNPATISGAYLIAYNCYTFMDRNSIATAAYDIDNDGVNEGSNSFSILLRIFISILAIFSLQALSVLLR